MSRHCNDFVVLRRVRNYLRIIIIIIIYKKIKFKFRPNKCIGLHVRDAEPVSNELDLYSLT